MPELDYFNGATVFITGASSGFGEEFARQLAPRVKRLILVARRLDRLEFLKTALLAAYPAVQIDNHQIDLSDAAARAAFCALLKQPDHAIDLLINNAGLGDIGKFASADEQKIEAILEVNIAALTALTRAVLPRMKKRARGAILNVSSLSAILPVPRLAVYAASKAYVSSFTESLRAELRTTGVRVTAVCPGPVDTEFGQVASRQQAKGLPVPAWLKVSPQKVVADSLRAVARDQARLFPGRLIQAFAFYLSLVPLPLLRRLIPLFIK